MSLLNKVADASETIANVDRITPTNEASNVAANQGGNTSTNIVVVATLPSIAPYSGQDFAARARIAAKTANMPFTGAAIHNDLTMVFSERADMVVCSNIWFVA